MILSIRFLTKEHDCKNDRPNPIPLNQQYMYYFVTPLSHFAIVIPDYEDFYNYVQFMIILTNSIIMIIISSVIFVLSKDSGR